MRSYFLQENKVFLTSMWSDSLKSGAEPVDVVECDADLLDFKRR